MIQNGKVQTVDDKVMPLMRFEKAETEVLPLVNNFNPITNDWVDISGVLRVGVASHGVGRRRDEWNEFSREIQDPPVRPLAQRPSGDSSSRASKSAGSR